MSSGTPQATSIGAGKSGATLVEVVVALSIFGLWLGAACSVMTKVRELTRRAQLHYTAVAIANSRLDVARSRDVAALPGFIEDRTPVDGHGNYATVGDFLRTTTMTNRPDGTVQIGVRVDLPDIRSRRFIGEYEAVQCVIVEFQERPA